MVWDSASYFFVFFFHESDPGCSSVILGTGVGVDVDGWCSTFIQIGNSVCCLYNCVIVDLSLMKPKILFVLVFHWNLARIILSMIFERVDNRQMGRWPFSPGLAIGMTIAVFHFTGSFLSIQDWLNKLRIRFF